MSKIDTAFKSNQDKMSCNELHSRLTPVASSMQYTSSEKEQHIVAEVNKISEFLVYPIGASPRPSRC